MKFSKVIYTQNTEFWSTESLNSNLKTDIFWSIFILQPSQIESAFDSETMNESASQFWNLKIGAKKSQLNLNFGAKFQKIFLQFLSYFFLHKYR